MVNTYSKTELHSIPNSYHFYSFFQTYLFGENFSSLFSTDTTSLFVIFNSFSPIVSKWNVNSAIIFQFLVIIPYITCSPFQLEALSSEFAISIWGFFPVSLGPHFLTHYWVCPLPLFSICLDSLCSQGGSSSIHQIICLSLVWQILFLFLFCNSFYFPPG